MKDKSKQYKTIDNFYNFDLRQIWHRADNSKF